MPDTKPKSESRYLEKKVAYTRWRIGVGVVLDLEKMKIGAEEK